MGLNRTFIFLCLLISAAWSAESLNIFFTGDIQGFVKSERPQDHGDILRIERVIDEMKQSIDRDNLLIFDTGDLFAYHYMTKVDSAATVLNIMRRIGYDGFVAGNFDFIYGSDYLEKINRDANFSIFASNIIREDSSAFLTPYKIYKKGDIRVGVIGIVEQDVGDRVLPKNFKGLTTLAAVKIQKLAKEVKQKSDILIAVNHLDYNENLSLAKQVPEIDVLIGKPDNGAENDFIQIYSASTHLKTTVVRAAPAASKVGHLELLMVRHNQKYKILQSAIKGYQNTTSVSEAEIDLAPWYELVEKYRIFCQEQYRLQPISTLADLGGHLNEQEFINFVLYTLLHSTHSEVAMLNHGFFRFEDIEIDGKLTLRELERIIWFNDAVVVIQLRGRDLKSLYNQSKKQGKNSTGYIHFLSVNEGTDGKNTLHIHNNPVKNDEIYRVATTNFLASGGDGYTNILKSRNAIESRFSGKRRLVGDPAGKQVPIKELIIRYLLSREDRPDFKNLGEWLRSTTCVTRPLWRLNFDHIALGFKNISVNNNEGFAHASDSRVRASTKGALNLSASGEISLVRETPQIRWENSGLMKYDRTRINNGDHGGVLQTIETNIEFQSIADIYLLALENKANPFASVRFDTEHTFSQRILYSSLGFSYVGSSQNYMRFGMLGKHDLADDNFNFGLEINTRYMLKIRSVMNDMRLRFRLLSSNQESLPGEEHYSLEFKNGFQLRLQDNLQIRPQLEIFIYKDRLLEEIASNIQFSINLSYLKSWKFQYQKLFM